MTREDDLKRALFEIEELAVEAKYLGGVSGREGQLEMKVKAIEVVIRELFIEYPSMKD